MRTGAFAVIVATPPTISLQVKPIPEWKNNLTYVILLPMFSRYRKICIIEQRNPLS